VAGGGGGLFLLTELANVAALEGPRLYSSRAANSRPAISGLALSERLAGQM
jgi:hypothetical protein